MISLCDPWDLKLGTAFCSIGNAYSRASMIPEALAMHERDLQITRRCLREMDLRVAGACYNVGLACCKLGRFADAYPYLETALSGRIAALGPQHSDVADVLTCIAGVLACTGRHAEAVEHCERAAAARAAALGPADPSVGRSLRSAAVSRACLGEFARAAEDCRRARDILAASLGAHHPTTAEAERILGEISSGSLSAQVARPVPATPMPDLVPTPPLPQHPAALSWSVLAGPRRPAPPRAPLVDGCLSCSCVPALGQPTL